MSLFQHNELSPFQCHVEDGSRHPSVAAVSMLSVKREILGLLRAAGGHTRLWSEVGH